MNERMTTSGTARLGTENAMLRRWAATGLLFLALGLAAGAASAGDNAAFVSDTGVPLAMMPNGATDVVVRMRNTGMTTWETTTEREYSDDRLLITTTSYWLRAVGNGWGVGRVPVTVSVAADAEHDFRFRITAPPTNGSYRFRWRMLRTITITEIDVPNPLSETGYPFGAETASRTIAVGPDTAPSFAGAEVEDQGWSKDRAIAVLQLPAASGGNGPLSYELSAGCLPRGVALDRPNRRIGGTPRVRWSKTCTWKATDADSNTADSDAAILRFDVTVTDPGIRVSPLTLTVVEEKTEDPQTFAVSLTEQPTADVTVSVTVTNSAFGQADARPRP